MKAENLKSTSQQGFSLGIIIAIVALVAVGGLVAWRVLGTNNGGDSVLNPVEKKIAEANCEYDDKDLCKFFVSFKQHKSYKMSSVTTSDGQTSTMSYEVDGDKYHSVMTGDFANETIVIGKDTYTKAPNGTWWKQTAQTQNDDEAVSAPEVDYEEPTDDKDQPEAAKTTYKALGKEACGDLTCFKYQVIDPESADQTEYLWFDDKDYQLRRSVSEGPGSKSDTSFSYGNISVKAPDSYKTLQSNQYLMPGQNEPVTLPQ